MDLDKKGLKYLVMIDLSPLPVCALADMFKVGILSQKELIIVWTEKGN